jgi:hypothetical protein
MTRKEFLAASAAMMAAGGSRFVATAADGMKPVLPASTLNPQPSTPAPRNRHPYKGIDWATAHQIRSTTHVHCKTQADLDVILKRNDFLTLSNYYPSAPWWPLSKMTENYYRVHHDFPVMVKGQRVEGPFDWNKVVGQWVKELPPERQQEYPFKEGGQIFGPLPEGVLEAPNAEHHNFFGDDGKRIVRLHLNAPGSAFASGTFDQWQKRMFQTGVRGGYDFGSGEHWRTAVDRMIEGLIYPDGGGVTINHPKWSSHDRMFLLKMLDYDPRILGIEVVEGGANKSEAYWDWVLATGRQCFGFFVPDHSIRRKDGAFGVNVLVTPERSVHACLKAYREGNFYGALHGLNELKFTRIAFNGTTVEAETDKPARFTVITGLGVVKNVARGTSVKWTLEKESDWSGSRKDAHIFARIKAYALDGSGEELFTQPYMLVP